jgi:hypothetical protein
VSTLLYLSGEPGTGKTSLMRELTAAWSAVTIDGTPDAPARVAYYTNPRQPPPTDDGAWWWDRPELAAVEIGRHRPAFSGTDALPQTVIKTAEVYLLSGQATRETSLLLGEGARLANRRFLQAAIEADWRVVLVHLANAAAAGERRRARAAALHVPEQHPSWVMGRRTAAANLAEQVGEWGCTVLALDAARPLPELAAVVRPVIGALV